MEEDMLFGIKTLLVTSTCAVAAITADPITSAGTTLGNATPSVILGIVAVACVVALVGIYRDRGKDAADTRKAHDEHTNRLYGLIESSTATNQRVADHMASQTALLVEVKNELVLCHNKTANTP